MTNKIEIIELSNKNGLKVLLSNLGASIVEIWLDNTLLTMSPVNIKDLKKDYIYYGKTIGPICNRIKDGIVEIDFLEYQLPLNEKDVCNHSGKEGLSNVFFDYVQKENEVVFTHIYQGALPSKVSYKIKYTLNNDNSLRIDFEATPEERTIIALTNHTFFNLGEENINNLSMVIPASYYIELDSKSLVPLRKKKLIDCLDFNKEKYLTKDIDNSYLTSSKTNGYDHCFFLKKSAKCQLNSKKYSLLIETNYHCLQIYTDNYEDGVLTKNTSYKKRRSIAIEPEDSLLDRPIIKSGETYRRHIIYHFKKL